MHFDAAIGHRLEIADGIYTGRSIVDGVPRAGTWFMEKVSALQRFVTDHKMRVDLTRSVMIGDSEGDVPLLSHVGRPVAFNPSLALARIAKRRGWPIVLERKDAVYRIRDADFVRVIGQEPKVPYGNQR
jgi:phosphoserine phosphatase